MGGVLPCGKYYFEDYKDLKKLYKFLGKALKIIYCSILEKPKEYGPIKIDIDLEIKKMLKQKEIVQ